MSGKKPGDRFRDLAAAIPEMPTGILAVPGLIAPGEQPMPRQTTGPAIVDLVLADIHARDELGKARYGVRLQAHNGRDALRDAYEESLDQTFYLRQCIEEQGALRSALAEACDLAEEGWGYAGEYFNDKHDSAARIAELRKLAGDA